VGPPLQLPKVKDTLAERIVTQSTIHRILALEADKRNHALLRLLYSAGLRVSELCVLKWKDCIEREEGVQLTVFGKGGKTRYVLISNETWLEVECYEALLDRMIRCLYPEKGVIWIRPKYFGL
jgi:integrase/recombinase XerD